MWDETAADIEVIWVFGKPEYFCKRGWTGKSARRLSGKSLLQGPRNPRSQNFGKCNVMGYCRRVHHDGLRSGDF
jgi:hypothetical protein